MTGLATVEAAIPAHDEVLIQCTKKINSILQKAV